MIEAACGCALQNSDKINASTSASRVSEMSCRATFRAGAGSVRRKVGEETERGVGNDGTGVVRGRGKARLRAICFLVGIDRCVRMMGM